MKIEIDGPYKELYRAAYLRESRDGRKRVDLFNSNSDRTTVSYARYLMSCHLGRVLTPQEEVDHINGNRSDDRFENLQVLLKEVHRKKTTKEGPKRKEASLCCAFCGVEFLRWENLTLGKDRHFCSRSCNAKNSRASGWTGKINKVE